jgi:hypothetical protein
VVAFLGLGSFVLSANFGLSPAIVGISYGFFIGGLWSVSDMLCLIMAGESSPTHLRASVLGSMSLLVGLGSAGSSMAIMVGMLFVIIGNYLPKCKQSYTLGIKLPWTLNSEANWNATHRIGGKVWMLGGLLLTQCVFLPKNLLGVVILLILPALVLVPVVYSFVYYNRQEKK